MRNWHHDSEDSARTRIAVGLHANFNAKTPILKDFNHGWIPILTDSMDAKSGQRRRGYFTTKHTEDTKSHAKSQKRKDFYPQIGRIDTDFDHGSCSAGPIRGYDGHNPKDAKILRE